MADTIFFELEVVALSLFSLVIPAGLYVFMLRRKKVSRANVLSFGFAMVAMAGLDVMLLQRLKELSRSSPSLVDDQVFSSELTIAIYVLPFLLAGIGVNVISHVLITHFDEAAKKD